VVDGREIDLVRGELLIEIQTGSFSALRRKLDALVPPHRVHIVHPVAVRKWIVRIDATTGEVLGRRKSPKGGRIEQAFAELVGLGRWLGHPDVSVELVPVDIDELRRHEPGRAWRRKGWVVVQRELLEVAESLTIRGPADLAAMLPEDLPTPFSTADLAARARIPRALAQKMAWCLRTAGAIAATGKKGNAKLYVRRV